MHSWSQQNLYFDLAALLSLISFAAFLFSPFSLHAVYLVVWYHFCLFSWGGVDYKHTAAVQRALPAGCTSESGLRGRSSPLHSSLCQQCSRSLNLDISFSSTVSPPTCSFLSMQHNTLDFSFVLVFIKGKLTEHVFSFSTTCTHIRSVTPLRAAL